MVNKIKGKATDALFKKSRLIIQGYNDDGKEVIFTQSPQFNKPVSELLLC